MKNHNFKFLVLVLTVFGVLVSVGVALAETTTNIHLKVVSFDQVLFDDNFAVSPCANNQEGSDLTINAWCAIDQLSLSKSWTASSTWYSYGIMLNSINQYNGADGNYWLWYSNHEPGATSLNQHSLTDNENVLLTYGINPLKVNVATTTPELNSTSSLSVSYFDPNAWTWQPVTDCDLLINGETVALTDHYDLLVSTTTPYVITAKKSGWLDSPVVTINGVAPVVAPETPPQSSGGGGYVTPPGNFNVEQAVNFLIANQNSDGSIGASVIYSDWSAVALSAYGDSAAKSNLKNYLMSSSHDTASAVGVTDLDRRAMALMSLGVSPYDGTSVNYIAKIVATFDGQQIGDPTIFNDDIFSLLVLLPAGWKSGEPIVDKSLQFIISAQDAEGSWGSVDLTAAAVQVLVLAQTNGNLDAGQIATVSQSLTKAKNWLQQAQQSEASFNQDVFSTAWSVQAIAALNEPLASWSKNNQTPLNFLATKQMSDGGLLDQSVNLGTRLWATAYAIPAGLNKSWGNILNSFSQPLVVPEANDSKPIASSTPDIIKATTTPEIIIDEARATSTPEIKVSEKIDAQAKETKTTTPEQPNLINQPDSPRRTVVKQPVTPPMTAPDKVLGEKMIVSEIADRPTKPNSPWAAKIIFYVASGASLVLGAYLGWKFLFKKL